MTLVRRFALAVIVALLTISASGVSSLVMPEPCSANVRAGADDGTCAPTCMTCGCCVQAAEPVLLVLTSSPDPLLADISVPLPRLPKTDPRDILHVPKTYLA